MRHFLLKKFNLKKITVVS